MSIRLPATAAATLIALTLGAPRAHAEDGVWKVGTGYVIRFEKLDLTRPADRQILLAQVERAASRLCEGEHTTNRRRSCARQTLADVEAKLDLGLRASLDVARFERDGIQQAQR
jgi:UrcA family protein